MPYQITISITGVDDGDTKLPPVEAVVKGQMFIEADGKAPTYHTMKKIEMVVAQGTDDAAFQFVDKLVTEVAKI